MFNAQPTGTIISKQSWNTKKASRQATSLKSTYLSLLVTAQLKVLAAFDGQLLPVFAGGALHTQHDLLGGFGLPTHKGEMSLFHYLHKCVVFSVLHCT